MGHDFFERCAAAREVFEEAGEALGFSIADVCFGDDPRLDLTEFTQPAILTAEIAMYRALESEFGLRASAFGGHSLGEYSALVAARALPLADAVVITRKRGALMQAAVPTGMGTMAAVVANGIVERDFSADLAGLEVAVANRNSSDQVVLSGRTEAMQIALERLEKALADRDHRIVMLNVSAPFHSPMMKGIEEEFRGVLWEASARMNLEAAALVTSNYTGRFHEPDREAVVTALTSQISGTVDWIANMHQIANQAEEIFEVGPNRPLRTFFKSIGREVTAILSLRQAEALKVVPQEVQVAVDAGTLGCR